jgi:hypothetical protein
VGRYYYNGDGVDVDKEEAFRYYKIAADQGHADAQYNVGSCYVNGDGVHVDKAEAFRY